MVCRLRLKCDDTHAETRFCHSGKRMSSFKSGGALVQSTAGSWGVRISCSNGSNDGYTTFQRWCEGYWLSTPFGSFPFTSPPVRHRVPSRFNWTLPSVKERQMSVLITLKTLAVCKEKCLRRLQCFIMLERVRASS